MKKAILLVTLITFLFNTAMPYAAVAGTSQALGTPVITSPQSGSSLPLDSVAVSWTSVAGATDYVCSLWDTTTGTQILNGTWVGSGTAISYSINSEYFTNNHAYKLEIGAMVSGTRIPISYSAPVSFNVGLPQYDSKIISNTIPTTMDAGSTYQVSVKVQNTGSNTWSSIGGYELGLKFDYSHFGITSGRIPLNSGEAVTTNSETTFNFTMTPDASGIYSIDVRMFQNSEQWFGDHQYITIKVNPSSKLDYDATITGNTLPSEMIVGQSYNASITVKNTGSKAWTPVDSFQLKAGGASHVFSQGIIALGSAESVQPGSEKTFTFTMKADQAGTYGTDWQMTKNGTPFGEDFDFTNGIYVHTQTVTGIKLNYLTATVPINKTLQLTATVSPDNATNKQVTWISTRPDVASVSDSGLVTALRLGTTGIIARSEDNRDIDATCTIKVSPPPIGVTGISLDNTNITMGMLDGPIRLHATITPDDATNQGVSWKTDNDSIAGVDSNGWVTPHGQGVTEIIATSLDNPNVSAECKVTVNPYTKTYKPVIQDYSVNPSEGSAGDTFTFKLTVENQPSQVKISFVNGSQPVIGTITDYVDNGNGTFTYTYQRAIGTAGLETDGYKRYFTLLAQNDNGLDSVNSSFVVKPNAQPPTSLAAPVITYPSDGGTLDLKDIGVTWNQVTGATGYAYAVRDLTTNVLIVPPATTNSPQAYTTSTGFTISSATLTAGHQYRIWVASKDATNNPYPPFSEVGVTVRASAQLAAPVITYPSDGGTLDLKDIGVTWNQVTGATGYAYAVRDLTTNVLIVPPATTNSPQAYTTSTGFTISSATLTAGHQYRIWVASKDATNNPYPPYSQVQITIHPTSALEIDATQNASGKWGATLPTTGLGAGNYQVKAVGYSSSGQEVSEDQVSISLQNNPTQINQPPVTNRVVDVTVNPSSGYTTQTFTFTIKVQGHPSDVYYQFDNLNGGWQSSKEYCPSEQPVNGVTTYTVTRAINSPGTRSIKVTTDFANIPKSTTQSFTVNKLSATVVSVNGAKPTDGTVSVPKGKNIIIEAQGSPNAVALHPYLIKGNATTSIADQKPVGQGNNYTADFDWDTSGLASGSYQLKVTAVDSQDHYGEDVINVSIGVTIDQVSPGSVGYSTDRQNVVISGSGFDEGGNNVVTFVRVDGAVSYSTSASAQIMTKGQASQNKLTVSLPQGMNAGDYKVYVRNTKSGETGSWDKQFEIDYIKMAGIPNGNLSGTIDLSANVIGSQIKWVHYYLGSTDSNSPPSIKDSQGKDSPDLYNSPYEYKWDTTCYANGSYKLWCMGFDAGGNEIVEDSQTVIIDNPLKITSVDSDCPVADGVDPVNVTINGSGFMNGPNGKVNIVKFVPTADYKKNPIYSSGIISTVLPNTITIILPPSIEVGKYDVVVENIKASESFFVKPITIEFNGVDVLKDFPKPAPYIDGATHQLMVPVDVLSNFELDKSDTLATSPANDPNCWYQLTVLGKIEDGSYSVVKSGTLYVAIRPVAENFNATITWDDQARSLEISYLPHVVTGCLVGVDGQPVRATIKYGDRSMECNNDGTFAIWDYNFKDIQVVPDRKDYLSDSVGAVDQSWFGADKKLYDFGKLTVWRDEELPIVLVPGTFADWNLSDYYSIVDMGPPTHARDIFAAMGLIKHGDSNITGHFYDFVNKYQGKQYGDNDLWLLDPLGDSYLNFLRALEDNGYTDVNNYQFSSRQHTKPLPYSYSVFCYDTLKTPIQQNAVYLRQFVDKLMLTTGAPKVKLVTHSQGGLVARYYIEDLGGYNYVQNIVMIEPPNKGVAFNYSLWEGGEGDKYLLDPNIDQLESKWALDILIAFIAGTDDQKSKWDYIKAVSAVIWANYQEESPVQEMLPTFNCLLHYSNLSGLPPSNGTWSPGPKNQFLLDLNSASGLALLHNVSSVTTIVNTGTETTNGYYIDDYYKEHYQQSDLFDVDYQTIGMWSDGDPYIDGLGIRKPSRGLAFAVTNDGDGTVTVGSAAIDAPWCTNVVYHNRAFVTTGSHKGKIIGHQEMLKDPSVIANVLTMLNARVTNGKIRDYLNY